jgi:hypothetical protein
LIIFSIKRDIGHLCHDEVKPPQPKTPVNNNASATEATGSASSSATPAVVANSFPQPPPAMMVESNDAFRTGVSSSKSELLWISNLAVGTFPFTANVGASPWPLLPQAPLLFQSDTGGGNEFSVLRLVSSTICIGHSHNIIFSSEFLESLDDRSFFAAPAVNNPAASLLNSSSILPQQQQSQGTNFSLDPSLGQISPTISSHPTQDPITPHTSTTMPVSLPSETIPLQNLPQMTPDLNTPSGANGSQQKSTSSKVPEHELEHVDPLPPSTKTERFLLTAADQESGTRDERLAAVIHAKYEAGLLKPYNYVKGYARLSRWMERK